MRKILYTSAHALEETDVGYDLGRSTSNNLFFEEILDDQLVAELREASVGYGTTSAQSRNYFGTNLALIWHNSTAVS